MKEGVTTTNHMIRRNALILSVAVLAAAWLWAAAAPALAASPETEMRGAVMALRGLIDRQGAAHYFTYPTRSSVRAGYLDSSWWPHDPWTGSLLSPGTTRGHYDYRITADRRRYRLVGYLSGGERFVVTGGMPKSIMLAYDHRSEEGINLIRQYIEDYAARHEGRYPPAAEVDAEGAVGTRPHRYWPSNPWDHLNMEQRGDRGSFAYAVAADRQSYTLRLHRALKNDYVLTGTIVTSPWQQLLTRLEDEIMRRSGRILAGYVGQWSLQHAAVLPTVVQFTPDGAVGAEHGDWPEDPTSGVAMHPGSSPGAYTYAPGAGHDYALTIHLHSGEFDAGGIAPALSAPARGSGSPGS